MKRSVVASLAMVLPLVGGCFEFHEAPSITSDDPSLKVPAIKQAVQAKDCSAIGPLVEALDSDDPAVRFYAIEGLRKLTGEDFGYRFYADESHRQAATEQWQRWAKAQLKRTEMAGASD
jgi:hypothetical protein